MSENYIEVVRELMKYLQTLFIIAGWLCFYIMQKKVNELKREEPCHKENHQEE